MTLGLVEAPSRFAQPSTMEVHVVVPEIQGVDSWGHL